MRPAPRVPCFQKRLPWEAARGWGAVFSCVSGWEGTNCLREGFEGLAQTVLWGW